MKNKIQCFDDEIKKIELDLKRITEEKKEMEIKREDLKKEFVYQDILGFFRYFYSNYPSLELPEAYYIDQIFRFYIKSWVSTPSLWERYSEPIRFERKKFLLSEIERLENLEDEEIERVLGFGYWNEPSNPMKRTENLEIFVQHLIR